MMAKGSSVPDMFAKLGKYLVVGLVVLWASSALALDAAGITPEQIRQFKSLSPEQRDKVLKQLPPEQRKMAEQRANDVVDQVNAVPAEAPEVVIPKNDNEVGSTVLEAEPVLAQPNEAVQAKVEEKPDNVSQLNEQAQQAYVLKPFGYSLFAGTPTTFAPATDIPVPAEYVLGPGDVVQIQLLGKESASYELAVTREGAIMFPKIGPVTVVGLTFEELRHKIRELVSQQLIGQEAHVTMGSLRSVRVFVLGEANRPGSYTVSALSTMTNALFVSGGISERGSLRTIQLKRNGDVISEIDLYDLLLKGDTSKDVRLQPGDVLFIPTVGKTVGVAGQVKRPAIYELRDETSVGEILDLAGGRLPTAYGKGSRIARINTRGERTVINVNTDTADGRAFAVQDGDIINIFSVLDAVEDAVHLKGHVTRPGSFEWKRGMRVSDVIRSSKDLLPNPDLDYALVVRELAATRTTSVLRVSLREVISAPGQSSDITLQPRDELMVFGVSEPRTPLLERLIDTLNFQGTFNDPPKVVTIRGQVRFPGVYPLFAGMTVGDLIRSSRDVLAESDLNYVLLVRKADAKGKIEVKRLSLSAVTYASVEGVTLLRPQDEVLIFGAQSERQELLEPVIKQLRAQADQQRRAAVVAVSGNVRFPGEYPLDSAKTVADLIRAAGGLLDSAYNVSAEITRFEVKQHINREVTHFSVELAKQASYALAPEDALHVQQIPNWQKTEFATIQGEVRFPGKYVVSKNDTIASLVARAGGLTEVADPNAAIFLREALRVKEQALLEQLSRRLRAESAAKAIEEKTTEGKAEDAQATREKLVQQVTETQATGRLVIDLPAILSRNSNATNVELQSNDELVIPRRRQEVSVIGEVNFPTAQVYRADFSVSDYVDGSGGTTARADESRIFVIRANGEVVSNGGSKWFRYRANESIRPGDTVVVPYDMDPVNTMETWTSVSQILFQMATSAAALKTLGIF
jgi:polysaccharide biosynthesis/export protein